MEGSTITSDNKGNVAVTAAVHFDRTLARPVRETEAAAKETILREQENREKDLERSIEKPRLYTLD